MTIYHKLVEVFQKGAALKQSITVSGYHRVGNLLQRGAVATAKWDRYYKLGQLLQRRAVFRSKVHQRFIN